MKVAEIASSHFSSHSLLLTNVFSFSEGLFYWSRSAISINPIKLENQRRYIGPRLYENSVSSAVEATSWALLVFLAREGISPFVESIVQWLVSVRMTNNGFISVSVSCPSEILFAKSPLNLFDLFIF